MPYNLYTVMNPEKSGLFRHGSAPPFSADIHRFVQFPGRAGEQGEKGQANDSPGRAVSTSAATVEQDLIFKEPFWNMAWEA